MRDRFINAIKDGRSVAVIGKDGGFFLKKILHQLGIKEEVCYCTTEDDVKVKCDEVLYAALSDRAERYGTYFDVCARLVDGEIASITRTV